MARERYLLHAGEDTIHDPEAEKKAEQAEKTPRGKWGNFWFYHKWHVLIGAAVVLVAAWIIVSTVQTVRPDYTVGLLSQTPYPDTVLDSLAQGLEKYGKDLNGDGKVVVQVAQYTLPAPAASGAGIIASGSGSAAQLNLQQIQVDQTKFVTDISSGTSMIFICDDKSFLQQEKSEKMFAYSDGSTPPANAADYEKMRIALEKCPKLAGMNLSYRNSGTAVNAKLTDVMKNCSISMRCYKGTAVDGKQDSYYSACRALFQKLIS